MKELTSHQLTPDVGVVAPVQQKKTFGYLGGAKTIKGLRLYEVNEITLEVQPADIHIVNGIDEHGKPYTRRNVAAQKDCVYVQALNPKNAVRKAAKFIEQQKKATPITHAQ